MSKKVNMHKDGPVDNDTEKLLDVPIGKIEKKAEELLSVHKRIIKDQDVYNLLEKELIILMKAANRNDVSVNNHRFIKKVSISKEKIKIS